MKSIRFSQTVRQHKIFILSLLIAPFFSTLINTVAYPTPVMAWCDKNYSDNGSDLGNDDNPGSLLNFEADCVQSNYDGLPSEVKSSVDFGTYQEYVKSCTQGNADGNDGDADFNNGAYCINAVTTCLANAIDTSRCADGDRTASIVDCNQGRRRSDPGKGCDAMKNINEDSVRDVRNKAVDLCSSASTDDAARRSCTSALSQCNNPGFHNDGTPHDNVGGVSAASAPAASSIFDNCLKKALAESATNEEDCTGRGGEWKDNKCSPSEDFSLINNRENSNPNDPSDPNDSDNGGEEVTCAVDGVGWIVCPISNFLAKIADTAYNLIEGFLGYNMMSDAAAKDKLQKQWSVFANLANVAFVIVFLIVIFSQVSGWGMDNYSLKRMMPRLIVGAILVNASFWICAIAVDMSNILGTNLKELLTQSAGSGANNGTWESVMSSILTGTAVVGTAIVIGTVGAALSGGFFALLGLALPVLIGALVAIFTVFLILVARQALITILIVLAPLAFVANLLPNTEQWYKRWQKAFMGVLVVFPAIAILFGGAQLAAGILMSAGGITMNIFALGVQAAPLFLVLTVLKKLMQVDGIAGMSQRFGGKLGGALGKKGQEAANRRQAKFNANHMAPSNHSRWDPRRYAGGAARRAKQHAWEDGITEQRANEAFRSSNSERLRNDPEYRMRMAGNNEDTANLLRAQAEQQGVEEATKHKQAFQTRYDDMSSDAIMSELGLTIDNDGNIDGMEQALERNGAQVAAAVAALGKRGFDNNGHLAGISNAVIAHAEGSSMARGAVAESMTNLGVMGAGAANAMRMEGPGGDNLDRRLAASAAGMSEENIAKLRGSEFAAVANAAQQTGNFDAMTNLVDKSERLINPDHRLHGQIKEGTIQEMERLGIRRP